MQKIIIIILLLFLGYAEKVPVTITRNGGEKTNDIYLANNKEMKFKITPNFINENPIEYFLFSLQMKGKTLKNAKYKWTIRQANKIIGEGVKYIDKKYTKNSSFTISSASRISFLEQLQDQVVNKYYTLPSKENSFTLKLKQRALIEGIRIHVDPEQKAGYLEEILVSVNGVNINYKISSKKQPYIDVLFKKAHLSGNVTIKLITTNRRKFARIGEISFLSNEARDKDYYVIKNNRKITNGDFELTIKMQQGTAYFGDFALYSIGKYNLKRLVSEASRGPFLIKSGFLGFVGISEHNTAPFIIKDVSKGTISDKAGLKINDILIKVDNINLHDSYALPSWQWFQISHEKMLANMLYQKIIYKKEEIKFTVIRNNTLKELSLNIGKVDVRKLIASMHKTMLENIVKNQQADGSFDDGLVSLTTSFSLLALLGTGDKKYYNEVKKAAYFLVKEYDKMDNETKIWHYAFAGIALSEYYLATGDTKVLAWIKKTLKYLETCSVKSASGFFTYGHKPFHLPYTNKGLVASATHVILFEALANKAKIKSSCWQKISPYIDNTWGKTALGYSPAAKSGYAQSWSRTLLYAAAANMQNKEKDKVKLSLDFARNYYPWMGNSHAYGMAGSIWGMVAISGIDHKLFNDILQKIFPSYIFFWHKEQGMQYSTFHMNSKYIGKDKTFNAAVALVFSCRNKKLHLSGNRTRNWYKAP